jgi:hypothetical protein
VQHKLQMRAANLWKYRCDGDIQSDTGILGSNRQFISSHSTALIELDIAELPLFLEIVDEVSH